jgi:hypothetical protein
MTNDYGYEVMCNYCRQYHAPSDPHHCAEREQRLQHLFTKLDNAVAESLCHCPAQESYAELITHEDALWAHEIGVVL